MATVILEGPNKTGKTTLGLRMSDDTGLGYYRRRTVTMMRDETLRVLRMRDVIADRGWLTDLHYSTARGRSQAANRHELYMYGLLAETYCVLLVKLTREMYLSQDGSMVSFGSPLDDNFPFDKTNLEHLYALPHWTEPERTQYCIPRPDDKVYKCLLDVYRKSAEIVAMNPFGPEVMGTRLPHHADILIHGGPTDTMIDMLFLSGIQPKSVVFSMKVGEDHLDALREFYHPKGEVTADWLKRVNPSTFKHMLEQFQGSFIDAGIKPSRMDFGDYS